jgi:hypothetical protein
MAPTHRCGQRAADVVTSVAASGVGDPASPSLLPAADVEPVDPDDY